MLKRTTGRGFTVYEFEDRYGAKCSLQESSVATLGHIWLGMDLDAKGNAVGAVVDGHHTGARMHLSRAQVAELLPLLQNFVATGTLGEPDPNAKPVIDLIKNVLQAVMEDAMYLIEEDLR